MERKSGENGHFYLPILGNYEITYGVDLGELPESEKLNFARALHQREIEKLKCGRLYASHPDRMILANQQKIEEINSMLLVKGRNGRNGREE